MKKTLILTACCLTFFASLPAEDQNSSLQPIVEKEPQQIQVASPDLPSSTAPEAAPTTPTVQLSTESPAVETAPMHAANGLPSGAPSIVEQTSFDLEEDIAAMDKEEKEVAEAVKSSGIVIDLGQVFAGSPTIYMVLFALSVASIGIWAYSLLKLRTPELLPTDLIKELREKLKAKNYNEALTLCETRPTILFQMLSAGIQSREQGQKAVIEVMTSEGKRSSTKLWQKISLLNDIAVIAPMIGLLGTVLGMFYAFYDLNRSMESISALFDGLGVSVGTTVGGLIVAILALIFNSMTKYRLTRQLAVIETEAHSLANLIDNQG